MGRSETNIRKTFKTNRKRIRQKGAISMLEISIKDGKIYSYIRDKWLVCTPEEEVRQGFIHTLINKFGYLPDQIAEEVQVNNSQRGQGQARADIVVWKSVEDKINNKSAFIVVECKAENVKIHEEDYYQGYMFE